MLGHHPTPAPVSEENFRNYGASTTPTLVLIDRAGIVRLYHPGAMTYEELRAAITSQPLFRADQTSRGCLAGRESNAAHKTPAVALQNKNGPDCSGPWIELEL